MIGIPLVAIILNGVYSFFRLNSIKARLTRLDAKISAFRT
jgi:hypothetical protein